jgi:hypothetical protein
MDGDRVTSRRELMAPYRRPYRHVLAETWRGQRDLRRLTVIGAACFVVGAAGVAAGVPWLGLLAGLGATMAWLVPLAWLGAIGRAAWRLTRSWRRRSELGTVRARRPQAGGEDPDVAHDEFAVTVEDDGWLLTWRFRPLHVGEQPAAEEIEVPGRPRYGARVVADRRFDARDTARAAEQLVAAQDRAEQREVAAAAAARDAIADAARRAELALEARSTAAALQRSTGQRSRRG